MRNQSPFDLRPPADAPRHSLFAQVPLCTFLGDAVPALAAFAKEGEQTTVLDALTDAAEALQMLDLKQHAPEGIPLDEEVGGP